MFIEKDKQKKHTTPLGSVNLYAYPISINI